MLPIFLRTVEFHYALYWHSSVPFTFLKEEQIEPYEISVNGSDSMEQNSPWVEGIGLEVRHKCGM